VGAGKEPLEAKSRGLVDVPGPQVAWKDVEPNTLSVMFGERNPQSLRKRRVADTGASTRERDPSELDNPGRIAESGKKHEANGPIRSDNGEMSLVGADDCLKMALSRPAGDPRRDLGVGLNFQDRRQIRGSGGAQSDGHARGHCHTPENRLFRSRFT
jgi:hypothetical protein